jgi:tRNA/tmRNA/rRNA uracil-C5-methylase (TrmA/RlmC/RlmD family)
MPVSHHHTTDELVVDVQGPAHGGYCVARHDGIVVFVSGALPGEQVRVHVTSRRSKFWRAQVVDVLQPSPDRVEHIWPEATSAADLGHVALPAQRDWKSQVISELMSHALGQAVDVPVHAAPGDDARGGLRWRTRVRVAVDNDGRPAMFAQRSHELIPLKSLPLAHLALEQEILGKQWPGARSLAGVAPSQGNVRIISYSSPHPQRGRAINVKDRSARVTEVVNTPDGPLTLSVAADGFWQVHSAAPEVLTNEVLRALGAADGELEGCTVWDLYAGGGLFTLPLALSVGKHGSVVAVESAKRAAADALVNIRACAKATSENIDQRTVIINQSVEAFVRSRGEHLDAIVLDPPRAGVGEKLMTALCGLKAHRIVYVSCDPATLARDLGQCVRAGYVVDSIRGFDLFPHTHHVECVASLRRA